MCFSAGVSFASSGALSGIGLVTVLKTKKYRMIAVIPLLFGVQQFIEGLQWLSPHPSQLSILLGHAFLFFAFLLWPVFTPLAVLSTEQNKIRKKILYLFTALGIFTSTYLLAVLLTQPLSIGILQKGINYQIFIPAENIIATIYIACIAGSLFTSGHKFIRIFGILALLSAIVALIIFRETFTSVWCFFAALLSLLLIFYLGKKELS